MAKHAMLSASGSSRWLTCTPSARLELGLPNTTSTYAEEGTAAHEVAELTTRYWLAEISEQDFENARDDLAKGEYYSGEMQEYANDYARFIYDRFQNAQKICADPAVELEVKGLDFSEWVPEGHGTGDCIIVTDRLLEIIDLKYGKGNRVDAINNSQIRLYALGAIARYGQLYDLETVRMTILQPRLSSEPSVDEMPISELLDWAENYVKPRAKLAYDGKGDFAPGPDTCKFCRAKQRCRARAEFNLALFDDAPEDLLLDPDEAGKMLARAKDIKSWLADLDAYCTQTLLEGKPVEGWKLVEGRSTRQYTDAQKVAEAMQAAGYEKALLYKHELLPLTQLEKDFGKKAVGEVLKNLIEKPAGKPTLAPATDKRPTYTPNEQLLAAFDE